MGSPALETKVEAVLDRDENIPYTKVLDTHNLNPKQFLYAVRDMRTFIPHVKEEIGSKLRQISDNLGRTRELFNMGEEFLREQYDRIIAEEQLRFYEGTLIHPRNREFLIYYALISNNPDLASKRRRVIQGIKSLPDNLERYLHSIRLKGIMTKLGKNSPFAVMEIFDKVYQERTKDFSLFDLTQKEHMHKWRFCTTSPNHYWRNPTNVEEAVYHMLTENNPILASANRKEVIQGVVDLPNDLRDYLRTLELSGLMILAFEKQDCPLLVLKAFDRSYQRETGNPSLFDKNQYVYLEISGRGMINRKIKRKV